MKKRKNKQAWKLEKPREKNKKGKNEKKLSFNILKIFILLGIVLLVVFFVWEMYYILGLIGLILIYFSASLYFILSGDKPYSKSWNYLKECKSHVLLIILIFLLSGILALYYQPPEVVDIVMQIMEELVQKTEGLGMWQMIIFILNNNLQSSFFGMILGLVLGIFPVMTAFANGYILGFVAEKSVAVSGVGVLWRLAPHGIFELPAIFISLALGTKLGMFITSGKGKIKKEFLRRLEQTLRVFLFVVIPLLIIAAIIEGILIIALG